MQSMKPLLAAVRDNLRTQLWPLPLAGVILAVAAGVAMPRLDAHLDGRLPPWLLGVFFGGDVEAAQTLLDTIAGSLITVTSLTFSLTVVTLQLASTQFSPRLLRTFTSDVFVQCTLALFLATFSYALTLLRAVRGGGQDGPFVPRISVTLAFTLGILSVMGLVLFLAHLARQIRVETMLRDVHADARVTVESATRPRRDGCAQPPIPSPPPGARRIFAPSSGFLTTIDDTGLFETASYADARLFIDCHPGSPVVEGVPIGFAWSDTGELGADELDRLQAAVCRCITVGYERTAAQDPGYGLRQLTDVANKALSPGINDPTTAVHALGHISAILCQLAGRELGPIIRRGDDGRIQVVIRRPGFAEMLDAAITQPRRFGASDPLVMARLFGVLEELAWHVEDEAPLRVQLARLERTVSRADFDDVEVAQLAHAAWKVEQAITARASEQGR